MNYYIQGDAANAERIKAAFEKLGIDVLDFGFADKTLVYCSIGSSCVQSLPYSINLMHILYSHPDYKELELPVEPKFKMGCWYLCTKDFYGKCVRFDKGNAYYCGREGCLCQYEGGANISIVSQLYDYFKLWTIADAKDGDVLATDNGWTCIFKTFDGCVFSSYFFMDSQKWFYEVGSEAHTLDSRINGNIHPATKEQRGQLFAKMKEAGYEWDEKKKELCKIKHYDITNFKAGMPVLVRETSLSAWQYVLFSHCYIGGDGLTRFNAGLVGFTQCIPFNDDTKHLLGTTNPCDEQYINW